MKRAIILMVLLGLSFAPVAAALEPGDTLWTRTCGGSQWEEGHSVQQTSDGGYIIAGFTGSFGAGGWDVYLVKTDPSGNTLWTRAYGGIYDDQGWSVEQTTEGGYIIAGWTRSFGAGSRDVYLVKADSSGDTVWTSTYGGSEHDYGYSVQQTLDGGYIIAGASSSFGAGSSDVYLLKTDSLGDTLWTRTYGGRGDDGGWSVQQSSDGGYVIAGYTKSFGAGGYDVYLLRTDSSGDTLWTRTYGGSRYDWGRAVQQTSDQGYVIGGYSRSFGAGGYNVYLLRTDSSGDTLWTRTYGGTDYDHGHSVQQTSDGNYIVAGATHSFGAGEADMYLVRVAGERRMVDFDIKPQSCPNPLNIRPYHNEEAQPRGVLPTAILGTEDFDVNDIDPTTVTLEGVCPVRWAFEDVAAPVVDPQEVCDCTEDGPDGYLDLTLKFSRSQIIEALGQPPNGELPLTVAGVLYDGTGFEGVDCVVIINSPYEGSGEPSAGIPASYVLRRNIPNPFNAATTITYGLPEAGRVTLEIYNLIGRKVATLVDNQQEAGYKSVTWDASNVSSGLYFYRLTAGDFSQTKRMMLVK